MKRLSIRSEQVLQCIRGRTDFRTHGNLWGVRTEDPSIPPPPPGRLSGAWREVYEYHAEMDSIRYVVMSYRTPIAWWTWRLGWYTPEVKHSATTTRHQGRVNAALYDYGPLARYASTEPPAEDPQPRYPSRRKVISKRPISANNGDAAIFSPEYLAKQEGSTLADLRRAGLILRNPSRFAVE